MLNGVLFLADMCRMPCLKISFTRFHRPFGILLIHGIRISSSGGDGDGPSAGDAKGVLMGLPSTPRIQTRPHSSDTGVARSHQRAFAPQNAALASRGCTSTATSASSSCPKVPATCGKGLGGEVGALNCRSRRSYRLLHGKNMNDTF